MIATASSLLARAGVAEMPTAPMARLSASPAAVRVRVMRVMVVSFSVGFPGPNGRPLGALSEDAPSIRPYREAKQ